LERGLVLETEARHVEPQDLRDVVPGSDTLGGEYEADAEGLGESVPPPPAPPRADDELRELRTKVLVAETGLTGRDLELVRRQHLHTSDLGAITEPAVLSDYLAALPHVPRAVHP
jgi:hypothetical protein